MKTLPLIFLLWIAIQLHCLAQEQSFPKLIRGRVIDQDTKRPIPNIRIKMRSGRTVTGNNGEFSMMPEKLDTLKFSGFNYLPLTLPYAAGMKTELLIELRESQIGLQEVAIVAKRNHKKDSLQKRKEYASVFNYKASGWKSVFVPVSSHNPRLPFEFVSLNIGGLVSLLTSKNNKQNKFRKKLLRDESAAYVNSRYNEELVAGLSTGNGRTALSGDSLYLFLNTYRPPKDSLLQMTNYQLLIYLKSKLIVFRSEAGNRLENLTGLDQKP
ncbi:carboxypeptidase-like regulatory domain-containing protein [Pedobacter gandavensis]|uniref:carboxypeptidase-like regulatory domain-containing protein n=1 Tax=Pedobacter gandavensis TaxID=2679963 RepID=UPI00292D3952|nr:carboxypeptidase-like regulatory domain-containing protein [Pedobacter gandavensis]